MGAKISPGGGAKFMERTRYFYISGEADKLVGNLLLQIAEEAGVLRYNDTPTQINDFLLHWPHIYYWIFVTWAFSTLCKPTPPPPPPIAEHVSKYII